MTELARQGEQLGDCRLLERLGSRGQGERWLAEHAVAGRVELFLGPHDPSDAPAPPLALRGLREVVDEFVQGKLRGVALRWTDAQSLERALARRPGGLGKETTAAVGAGVAEVLARLHALGQFHGELTPAAVLVEADGSILLEPPWSRLGLGGLLDGGLAYNAPEQASLGRADAHSDIFTLGVLLAEMLTGRAPFQRATELETLAAVRRADPPTLPALGPAVHPALSREPGRRPGARELMEELLAQLERPPATDGLPSEPRELEEETEPYPAPSGPIGATPLVEWQGSSRFELLSRLGRGGMGEVFKVRDRELDVVVALKLVPRDTTIFGGPERLKRELRLARRIASPFVCRIHDLVDLGDGARGLTMELVGGHTLAEELELRPFTSPSRAARWCADLAEGLAAAHELNIVHRDLKPSNVMIREDGRAVILDFGIAKPSGTEEERERLTQRGIILGTPLYMSPEHLLGLPLDGRSDLFSLGLILAELITGEVPMRGSGYAQVLERRVHRVVPLKARDLGQQVPAELATLIEQLVRPVSTERPASAMLVAAQLRRLSRA